MNVKELLEKDYIVVCDTNVFLNVYRYSPEFTDFAIKCLRTIKESIVIPATVDIEYRKHRKPNYYAMRNRVKKASDNLKSQIDSSKQKISNTCELLASLQYPDIDELRKKLLEVLETLQKELDCFFEDRSVLEQIADAWGERDYINELFDNIVSLNKML